MRSESLRRKTKYADGEKRVLGRTTIKTHWSIYLDREMPLFLSQMPLCLLYDRHILRLLLDMTAKTRKKKKNPASGQFQWHNDIAVNMKHWPFRYISLFFLPFFFFLSFYIYNPSFFFHRLVHLPALIIFLPIQQERCNSYRKRLWLVSIFKCIPKYHYSSQVGEWEIFNRETRYSGDASHVKCWFLKTWVP